MSSKHNAGRHNMGYNKSRYIIRLKESVTMIIISMNGAKRTMMDHCHML